MGGKRLQPAGNKQKKKLTPEEAMGNTLKPRLEHAEKTGMCSLSKCQLKEFPGELMAVSGKLRSLDISLNKIKQIPDTIGQLLQLKILNVSNNKITKLPDSFCLLVKLETCNLSNNCLQVLPANFGNLKSLKTLNLSSNELKKFPMQLTILPVLDMCDLSSNKISEMGDTDEIGQLNCSELILNMNQLASVPSSLSKCSRLKILRLQENCLPLSGIPASLLSESSLNVLSTEGNLFEERDLHLVEGWDSYQERYTAAKKKMY